MEIRPYSLFSLERITKILPVRMKNVFTCDGKSIFGYCSLNKPLNH